MEKVRLAKYLSWRNLCSRREAERLITEGKVKVNDQVVNTPVCFVDDSDQILLNGVPVASGKPLKRLWLYYKPVGEITTHQDPDGRLTVFQSVKNKGLPRVVSVGRLDINSEGLLLLTNNSALAHQFEKPSTQFKRIYKVRFFGVLNMEVLKLWSIDYSDEKNEVTLRNIILEKIHYAPLTLSFEKPLKQLNQKSGNTWCTVQMSEGKNREIRKILEALGVQVNRLIRIKYGPFALDNMKPGEIREVSLASTPLELN